ncbi:hypothetical protein QCD79_09040, partial [Pseudomonas quasicaspiana]|nr:hypothetical protein [Pseudomonas quasicaspiana]
WRSGISDDAGPTSRQQVGSYRVIRLLSDSVVSGTPGRLPQICLDLKFMIDLWTGFSRSHGN